MHQLGLSLGTIAFVPAWLLLSACQANERVDDYSTWTPATSASRLYPETTVRAASNGKLNTKGHEVSGAPAGVGCATCHERGSEPAFAQREGAPKGFHGGVKLEHGKLPCGSCHQPGSPQNLRLADATTVPMGQVIQLCSQCHGPQRRNYDHGAHGGKRGYWDRQRGPQERNDCVACHSPHAPAYPKVTPVDGPKDRFANPRVGHGSLVEQRYGEKSH